MNCKEVKFDFNLQKKIQQNPLPTSKQNGHMKGNGGSSANTYSNGISGSEKAKVPSEEKPVHNGIAEEQHQGSSQLAGPEAAERRKKSRCIVHLFT